MDRTVQLAVLGLVAAILVACATASRPGGREGATAPGAIPGVEGAGATATPAGTGLDAAGRPLDEGISECLPPCEFPREAIDDPASLLAGRLIYFDFDASSIKSEYLELIASHGRYLAAYNDTAVRLEGHTDERGSREYNVGLGERRAQAVRQQLLLQGVAPEQINTVSYGEELPAVLGHDDEAWRENRRVELVYESQ